MAEPNEQIDKTEENEVSVAEPSEPKEKTEVKPSVAESSEQKEKIEGVMPSSIILVLENELLLGSQQTKLAGVRIIGDYKVD